MSKPKRPHWVPQEAEWYEPWQGWMLCVHGDKSKQGVFKFWKNNGSYGENEGYFKEGKFIYNGHGKGFYANDEMWYSEYNEHGKIVGEAVHCRCSDSSKDADSFAHVGKQVWSFKKMYTNDGATSNPKFFTKDGKETDAQGNIIPQRPHNVNPNAYYLSNDKSWFYGLFVAIDDGIRRVGLWQWWSKDGILLKEIEYGDEKKIRGKVDTINDGEKGDLLKYKIFFGNGNLKEEAEYENGDKKLYKEYYETGILKEETEFENARIRHYKKFYDSGCLRFERLKRDNAIQCFFYYPDGKVKAEGFLDEGWIPSINWKFYFPDGTLISDNELFDFITCIDDTVQSKEEITQADENDEQKDTYYYLLRNAWLLQLLSKMETPSYLEGIDTIQWAELEGFFPEKHPYIPLYIKGLTSPNQKIQEASLDILESTILHQDTVEEVTAYVIPFLIKIVENNVASRQMVLDFLPYLVQDEFYSSYYFDEDEEDDDLTEEFHGTRDVAAEGFFLYEKLIHDANVAIRARAILMITIAHKERERAIQVLYEALQREDEEIQKGNIIYALSILFSSDDSLLATIESYSNNKSQLLRLCAALCSMRVRQGKVEQKVLDIIIEALKNPGDIGKEYSKLVFVEGAFESDIALALSYLDRKAVISIIPFFIQSMKAQDIVSRLDLTEAMLRLVFGENGYTGKKLTEMQKQVLGSIIEGQDVDAKFLNLTDILEQFNLPDDLREIQKLIQANKTKKKAQAAQPKKQEKALPGKGAHKTKKRLPVAKSKKGKEKTTLAKGKSKAKPHKNTKKSKTKSSANTKMKGKK